jgi:Leucine Rich Repeat
VGKLQELDLSLNKFTGVLSSCLENLTWLVYLNLSDNNLQINIPTTVFTNLTSLKYVSLSGNRLEGLLLLSTFSNHTKLKILELSSQGNNFPSRNRIP